MMIDPASNELETEARLLVFNPWVMLGGQTMFFAILLLIWLFFRNVVPPAVMVWWVGLAALLASFVVLFDLGFFLRRPGNEELLRFWRAIDKRQTVLFDAIAVAVIWLLLPYGGEAHRIVVVAFCVGYVPVQMISDPENAWGNKVSIVLVLGSFMLFLLLRGGAAMQVLAAMVALYGLVLYFSADAFRSVVVNSLRARRDLQLANTRLAGAVADVSAERDAKTRFIAAATHDLGQPLQAARLFGESAQAADDPAIRSRALGRMLSSIASAQSMLGNMLYHMRLEADAVAPRKATCDLAGLISGLADQHQFGAAAAGAQISVRAAPCHIQTDPVLLERALSNLLQNAIVHARARHIRLIVRTARDKVQMLVCDDGRGIAVTERALIFEDYRQGTGASGGFGLGLGSVRRLARLLEGELSLVERRKGACFALCMPRGTPA